MIPKFCQTHQEEIEYFCLDQNCQQKQKLACFYCIQKTQDRKLCHHFGHQIIGIDKIDKMIKNCQGTKIEQKNLQELFQLNSIDDQIKQEYLKENFNQNFNNSIQLNQNQISDNFIENKLSPISEIQNMEESFLRLDSTIIQNDIKIDFYDNSQNNSDKKSPEEQSLDIVEQNVQNNQTQIIQKQSENQIQISDNENEQIFLKIKQITQQSKQQKIPEVLDYIFKRFNSIQKKVAIQILNDLIDQQLEPKHKMLFQLVNLGFNYYLVQRVIQKYIHFFEENEELYILESFANKLNQQQTYILRKYEKFYNSPIHNLDRRLKTNLDQIIKLKIAFRYLIKAMPNRNNIFIVEIPYSQHQQIILHVIFPNSKYYRHPILIFDSNVCHPKVDKNTKEIYLDEIQKNPNYKHSLTDLVKYLHQEVIKTPDFELLKENQIYKNDQYPMKAIKF